LTTGGAGSLDGSDKSVSGSHALSDLLEEGVV
jgi:hypothetical protein